ncbi:ABC transporter substrate-binding protein [Mycobacterium sp. MS1601]|uniref:ABC transporter substrate-binding protein n=1 Tax=Mycobacterium sp. MS1601 TaxID=1936029 RepID=UPI00097978B7|nr:ABC transporter substrate-binding protein [Mycobacterium sp. MS1601]AQA02190.1 ABC transporter substrate-binding protein [Mycobacterium sp. MS1601]
MFERRRFLLGVGAGGLAALGAPVLLSSCGSEHSTAPNSGEPVTGGTLRTVFAGTSATADVLDPHVVGHSAGGALSKSVWDRLVEYNNDLTLRYRLAEALEPNADGTQWRVRLRPAVEFSDGSPLTARDVMWSFERMLDPDKPSSGDLSMVDLAGSRMIDDLTLSIAMNEPLADFGSVLAGWYVYVVKNGTTTFDSDTLPVGTGPFVAESWSPGDRARLIRNDRYWDGPARLDAVEMLQIAAAEPRLNAFLSGEADVVYELAPAQANTLRDQPDIYLVTPPAGIMSAFQMRLDAAPFDDERVREALRLSVDREAMVDSVFYGFAEQGNDLYGKGAPFYNSELPQRSYDPDRARELLRAAGHENLTVTLHTADVSPGQLESATLFAEQAKKAGITVELQTEPNDIYFSQISGNRPFTQTGWWNYSLDYFYGQTMTSDAPSNGTGWKNPEWDRMFAEARAAMDTTRRAELYAQLQEQLWNEGGYILHTFALQPTAVRNHVQGIRDGVPGTGDWANFSTSWVLQ